MRRARCLLVGGGCVAWASAALVLGVENPVGHGLAAARRELQELQPAPGLEVSLFACEPMVRNPANMDVDAQGRVWVTEGANYRVWQKWGKLRPEGDRIVILEDKDGDGLADKETTFYQGNDVNTALGICVLGDKVIVSSSPNVLVFTDENGDGRADRKDILFSGIQGVDNDHGVHAIVFGPDGKLYFNMGNASHEIHRPDGSLVRDKEGHEVIARGQPFREGMTFRCNLDGSEFEVVGYNFRNPYEVTVDSFGGIWQSDNDDDGNQGVRVNFLLPHGNYGYADEMTGANWGVGWKAARQKGVPESQKVLYEWHQFDPGVVPDLLHTGAGSPTGICVYEGRLLPSVYQNQLLLADAGPRVVRSVSTEPDGAGYRARSADLLTSNDSWFRPSDICVAPDGAIYIADWNDAGVGGHYMADQKLETMTGRVYRLAPKGRAASVPKLDLTSPAGCVEALRSPNQATRYLAWSKLHEGQGASEASLGTLWQTGAPRERARALQLLARINSSGEKHLREAVRDPNPDVRATALRTVVELNLDVVPYVQACLHDPSPQVRRECALALRHNSSSAAPKLWTALAEQFDGRDRWYLEALGIGADQQWDRFLGAWLADVGDRWDSAAGRRIVWRSRGRKTPELLVKLINNKNTSDSEREQDMRAFDFITGPEKEAALMELLTSSITGK